MRRISLPSEDLIQKLESGAILSKSERSELVAFLNQFKKDDSLLESKHRKPIVIGQWVGTIIRLIELIIKYLIRDAPS